MPRFVFALALVVPTMAVAQFPSLNSIPGVKEFTAATSGSSEVAGQNTTLVRGYVAANKDVLIANSQMADALGLKDAAAASRATAEALSEGATKGNLEDADKAVSTSTDAVAAEMAKSPKLDAAAKTKYASGLGQLGRGMLKYVGLRKPAQDFSAGLKNASLLTVPKVQSGIYIASHMPTGVSNLFSSLQNAIAFAKSNDIPIPADATKALGAL